ncbi:hypothetical protein [Echinicola sp. 20G]|uniref:hypothetical protein n=1 Tax=Echinicola sp. 20G TaxID=2781961 RepID=UPI0019105869|nr:hypothetical protein [Echinicola sp. 20G]
MKKLIALKNFKGLFYGITYGLVARALFSLETNWNIIPTYGLMTLAFMFFVPFVIGLITAYYNKHILRASKILGIAMPVFSILGVIIITVLFNWEGIICALMAIPIFAVMSLIGGFIGIKLFYRSPSQLKVSLILFIPFLIAPIEGYFGLNEKFFIAETSIEINSTKEDIWNQITRVRTISKNENSKSLFQFLGFPRPIEASLDTIAIGGVRIAKFDKGLFFTETVTDIIPQKLLAFSIDSDPNSIPPSALDKHVLIGGSYFDVLQGKYELEEISEHQFILHLSSKFRLSTNFNFYSGLWSKLIMKDIQNNILEIIKSRTEKNGQK